MSSLFYTYLLTLGEFDVDHIQETLYPTTAIIMFVVMTLIMQVILLNMLIAIMSDTYDRVRTQQKEAVLKDRIGLIISYGLSNNARPVYYNSIYIFKKLSNQEGEEDDWAGKISEMKTTFKQSFGQLESTI